LGLLSSDSGAATVGSGRVVNGSVAGPSVLFAYPANRINGNIARTRVDFMRVRSIVRNFMT
jgi:hypothetical protein